MPSALNIKTLSKAVTATLFFIAFNTSLASTEAEKIQNGKKPLWEIALGAGGINQAYYVGNKQYRTVAFPVIFPVYRGDIFKSDDKGFRAEIIKDPRYQLDISSFFNFAVESDKIDTRKGMDDIGNLLQLGPSLEVNSLDNGRERIQLKFPLRAAFEFDRSNFNTRGFSFSPGIEFSKKFRFLSQPWSARFLSEVQYGTEDYHGIYYSVASKYSTAERPAYTASSGFSGYRLRSSLVSKNPKRLFVFFISYDNISNAVFNDSPLVETKENISAGFLFARYIFKSKRRAP